MKHLYMLPLLSIIFIIPIFTTLSCGWTVEKDNKLIIEEKEKLLEHKFNYPVMPEWNNLDIFGKNENEWIRLKKIYLPEIVNAKNQLSEIDESFKNNKNDLYFQKFYYFMSGLTKSIMIWYQQIIVEIELNLWLISERITFEHLLKNKNKYLLKNVEDRINLIVKTPNGLFNNWVIAFNNWNSWMNLNLVSKSERKTWERDQKNWFRVKTHLSLKKDFFTKQLAKIKK